MSDELQNELEEFQASYDALWLLTEMLLTLAVRLSPNFPQQALEYVETLAPYPDSADALASPDRVALLQRRERTYEILRQKLRALIEANEAKGD